ncbi:MAG: NifU family protein, partial [Chlamydiota bacterium]
MVSRSAWALYSQKLQNHAKNPMHVGFFTTQDAINVRCVIGKEGSLDEGRLLKLYLLIEEGSGVILDVKFQAFGPPDLIALADALCEMLPKKNYLQASRMSVDLLDKRLRDTPSQESFPESADHNANFVFFALFEACRLCQDIIIADPYAKSPVAGETVSGGQSVHQNLWMVYTLDEKLTAIRDVIAADIEPYIALDEGGVEVTELKNDFEVIVEYTGSCTSCFSSIGATLNAIQQILRDKVHPQIIVTPDM